MRARNIIKVVSGRNTKDGAGVRLHRVISNNDVYDFDPFLMLDAFDSRDSDEYILGFPWHPHRGIETVTYVIKGQIEHGDSIGNSGIISDGSCQWMTSGRGILHQEMPKKVPHFFGVQLWLNLPAENKMTEPAYHDLTDKKIPVVHDNGASIRIISGNYKDTKGSMTGEYVDMTFLDISLSPDSIFETQLPINNTLFIYIVSGDGWFGENIDHNVPSKTALLFGDGDIFKAKSSEDGVRFLLFSAKPLKEPVAWGGPIVMNTHAELRVAFQELEDGTFIK